MRMASPFLPGRAIHGVPPAYTGYSVQSGDLGDRRPRHGGGVGGDLFPRRHGTFLAGPVTTGPLFAVRATSRGAGCAPKGAGAPERP